MKRHMIVAAGMTLVLTVLTFGSAVPAVAQGPFAPILAIIQNDQSNPVPVAVVPPAPETAVVCSWSGWRRRSGTTFINGSGSGSSLTFVKCPTGITKVDVQRVVFVPGSQTTNVASYRATITLANSSTGLFRHIAYLTDGAPEADVIQPFVLDTSSTDSLGTIFSATSGISGVPLTLNGTLYLAGHPIQ